MTVDKEILHRILVHPTRTGLDKVEKEVARLNGVNDVLRQELVTWKDAVATRNETVVGLNNTITKLHDRIDTLNESRELDMKLSKKFCCDNAFRVERLRLGVQAAHLYINDLASCLSSLNGTIEKLEDEARETRNVIAGDTEIDWTKELSRESDDTDTE
jgi:predicted  nucleic acid-binding Zn-ribbon protein